MAKVNILITGVAGFIGSNLAKKLLEYKDKKYHVIGIDNLSQGTLKNIPEEVEFHKLDIRDKKIYPHFKNIDTVFHLAAKNCLIDCLKDPLETSDINVKGTVNVLEATRLAKVRKFIYADTSAEYEGINEFPSRVDKVCPVGAYAVSKRSGALFCESYKRLYGMNITILRYFNVYGPAQDWRRVMPPVMSAFIIKMLMGERSLIYGTGQKRRDFIYIDDVNDFHLLVINNERTNGNTYNVGTGNNYSVYEIYTLIEDILHTNLKPVYNNDLPAEAQVTLADITESKKIGWKPKIDIKEGLKKSIEYIKNKVLNESSNTLRR